MELALTSGFSRHENAARRGKARHGGLDRGPVSWLATLVLALATGTPLRSAPNFLPHPGMQAGPFLGV